MCNVEEEFFEYFSNRVRKGNRITDLHKFGVHFVPSGVPRGGVGGFKTPEIPKALQIGTKLNPIVKTVKNC